MTSDRLEHSIILFRAESSCGVPGKTSMFGSRCVVDSKPQRLLFPPSPSLHLLPYLLHPNFLSSSSAFPVLVLASYPSVPSWPSWAASHLPLRLGAHSKCTSLGWVAASYSMSERSQLGHSLMNHFLWDTVRKSLSEFGASSRCSMKLICPLLSVVEPGAVCTHVCMQPVTHAHKPRHRGLGWGSCVPFVVFCILRAATLAPWSHKLD